MLPLEEFLEGPGVDTTSPVGISALGRGRQAGGSRHGVGLAAPRLAIGKDAHVVPVEDRSDERRDFGVHLSKGRRRAEEWNWLCK